MISQQKAVGVLRSHDAQTPRALRTFLPSGSDLHLVHDLKSIENVCRDGITPLAIIVEAAATSPVPTAAGISPKDELIQFLGAVRQRFPTMRRVVIADSDDLSTAIH